MKQDVLRAIGYINMILDEYTGQMNRDDVESLQQTRLILQRLVK